MNSLEEQGAAMTNLHSALSAAIRALHGESDIDVIYPAIGSPILAQVIALASSAYPVIRTVAALRSGLTALLDPPDIAEPALHDVVTRLIGTNEMSPVLDSLAKIAPAGWGAQSRRDPYECRATAHVLLRHCCCAYRSVR